MWWCTLTRPGVTTAPPRLTVSSAAGGRTPPTAWTRPWPTRSQPPACSVPASSMVTTWASVNSVVRPAGALIGLAPSRSSEDLDQQIGRVLAAGERDVLRARRDGDDRGHLRAQHDVVPGLALGPPDLEGPVRVEMEVRPDVDGLGR